ncbi:MAG: hypothetical protein R2769_04275 [Saprospiraceae bacterium]
MQLFLRNEQFGKVEWAEKNCRISQPVKIENIQDEIITVIIRENSKIGSAEIEKISSDNLAYLITQNVDTSKLEKINIIFDLPQTVAVYGKEGNKVSKNYIFEDFELLNKYYSNNTVLEIIKLHHFQA